MANKYTCASCGALVTKPPLVVKRREEKDYGQGTLGTWHCTGKCPGKVKVKRTKLSKTV